MAVEGMLAKQQIAENPLHGQIAAVSVGVYEGESVLDLDYAEDSSAGTDMNVVALASGGFVEIQGTAEKQAFSDAELTAMLALARKGTAEIFALQERALGR